MKQMSWWEADDLAWTLYKAVPSESQDSAFELLSAFERLQGDSEDDELCPQQYICDFVLGLQEMLERQASEIKRAQDELENILKTRKA